ncbi:hypothetical protein CGRA01v4_14820 [Colletotrichum graminicola]|nr:hypothetical protein CGRA01v4_14820 [Colletotrichum graminicola]
MLGAVIVPSLQANYLSQNPLHRIPPADEKPIHTPHGHVLICRMESIENGFFFFVLWNSTYLYMVETVMRCCSAPTEFSRALQISM